MFNLEQAISEWRRQMRAAGIKTPVPLEELENHLREDFEAQVRAGVVSERAFEIAASRLGSPEAIQQEFGKVEIVSAPVRKLNYALSAAVAVLFCVSLVIATSNILHDDADLTLGWRISIAGALLSAGLLASAFVIRKLRQELGKAGKAMPTWTRKINSGFSGVLAVLCCAAAVIIFLVNTPHFHLTLGKRISIAGALLFGALFLNAWRFLWRFLPVLPAYTRVAVGFLCIFLCPLCVSILEPTIFSGAGTPEEAIIPLVWEYFVPMVPLALWLGLEEAAYRNAQRRAG